MSFLDDGYEIVDLQRPVHVVAAQMFLTKKLGKLTAYQGGDLELHRVQAELLADVPRQVIISEIGYFTRLMGADLHIQQKPYLRISRPGVADDNIGMHRDTWYGDTPYEISVWIPLTDTDEGNALRVAPGSHLWSEAAHPVERFEGGVEKGSVKHSLGFIHGSPKRLVSEPPLKPLPVRVGQMIVFSLALLHGVDVNRSERTRVSMDVRLTHSFAPVKFSRSRNETYYVPLCTSPVGEVAQRYQEANAGA